MKCVQRCFSNDFLKIFTNRIEKKLKNKIEIDAVKDVITALFPEVKIYSNLCSFSSLYDMGIQYCFRKKTVLCGHTAFHPIF